MFVPSYWHSRYGNYDGKAVPVWWHNFANAMAQVVHFLQNVLHFLEQIFPFTSSFILQHEPSVLLYPQQPGKELAVGIFIKGAIPATEGSGHTVWISRRSRRRSPPLEAVVVDLYTSQDMGKDFTTVVLLSGDLFQ